MNVSIIIAVCYYIVLIAQFGIMWKAKNPGENEIFSITVPNEKLENEEIKGVQKKWMDVPFHRSMSSGDMEVFIIIRVIRV